MAPTPERWQKIEELYHDALERGRDVLADADPELRCEVESLLAAAPTGTGSVERPTAELLSEFQTTQLPAGTRVGPYEIDGLIGRGGMGQVYRARDTRLGRTVALKTSSARFIERVEREARAIAALNHPHICQIYDVGPDYLVMEYIDGKPLRGPLPTEEALRLAIQVVDALEAAHRRGILHRDLKPGNLLVTESGVKLLDFGIAKIMQRGPDYATAHSVEGTVLGTPAYMSPEQAQGRPVDERSDVFSFGAVLYEVLSGRRAFGGDSLAEILSAVIRDTPAGLDSPAASVVARCLAKQPEQRFQTMAEVKAALEQCLAKRREQRPSIAVLPFVNMSIDKEQEFFSDGLAEEILNLLAKIPGLKVIARTSSFAFRGKEQDITKIAETLRVRTILAGSVRRSGNRIRVTTQLISAEDGSHLWSERYDRELADVFALQDEIAAAITGALQVELKTGPAQITRYKPHLAAHEALLKAWYHHWKLTADSVEAATEYYEQAIALDPLYALAHSGYAEHLFFRAAVGISSAHELMPLVRAEASKALELDPSLSEAHAILGEVAATYDYDWREAEQRYTRALAGDVFPWVRAQYAHFYLTPVGRLEEAVVHAELAVQGDPLHLGIRNLLGHCFIAAKMFGEAEEQARQLLKLDPRFPGAYPILMTAFVSRGMFTEALDAAEKAYLLLPHVIQGVSPLAGLLMRAGERTRAEELLSRIHGSPPHRMHVSLMLFCLLSGDVDQAADWAEKAIGDRFPALHSILSEFGKDLRTSSRWPKLAKMLNLPESVY